MEVKHSFAIGFLLFFIFAIYKIWPLILIVTK